MALLVRAGLGLDPWDVFHQGVTERVPLSFGAVVTLTGAVVLLAWIPLRQAPGIGTIANVALIGAAADASLWLLPEPEGWPLRSTLMVLAVVLNGLATGLYLGAGLGPGPRDGLMTGLSARTGWPLWRVRTPIEATVLAVGFVLGGTVGVATLVYALGIGPLAQAFLGLLRVHPSVVGDATGPFRKGGQQREPGRLAA